LKDRDFREEDAGYAGENCPGITNTVYASIVLKITGRSGKNDM